QEPHCLALRAIKLAVTHTRAGRHRLHVAALDDTLAAGGVLMGEGTFNDIADDFHVTMTMGGKAGIGRHAIVIDHAHIAEPHMRLVIVIGEGECMPAVEPADLLAAAFVSRATDDAHDELLFNLQANSVIGPSARSR